MERFAQRMSSVLNVLFAVLTAALAVLGGLSLAGGPTLRFLPYMAGVCGIYYLALALWTSLRREGRGAVKSALLVTLSLLCGAFAVIAYRCLR